MENKQRARIAWRSRSKKASGHTAYMEYDVAMRWLRRYRTGRYCRKIEYRLQWEPRPEESKNGNIWRGRYGSVHFTTFQQAAC